MTKWRKFRRGWLLGSVLVYGLLFFGGWYGAHANGGVFPLFWLDLLGLAVWAICIGLLGGFIGLLF